MTEAPASPLLEIIRLEESARAARTRQELAFVVVNETHRLVPYRQAFLCERQGGKLALVAISGLAKVERSSPFHDWFERLLAEAAGRPRAGIVTEWDAASFGEEVRRGWEEWLPPALAVIALPQPGSPDDLLLFLAREEALPLPEAPLAFLAGAFGHAWWALGPAAPFPEKVAAWLAGRSRRVAIALAASAALLLLVPIRQSALGTAEVTPLEYRSITAPLDGVIASVDVKPNETVREGTVLFRLDDTSLRNRLEGARRSLGVARSEAFLGQQRAFSDVQARSEVAVHEAKVGERGSTIGFLSGMLGKTVVTAPGPGIVLFGDASDWEGRPVSVGERIMSIADEASAGVTLWLPVADAPPLEKGAEVRLFLHAEPLSPRTARILRSSFQPVLSPEGIAAYRVTAEFVSRDRLPRLGLRGTAKVYGGRAPIAYHLLRRPLAKARQWLGL